ncbi:putative solute carrier family 22 member 3 [Apostichopus japonicus]|uniref:Putative solute carrier family 22 member 3 n=1 Tax=Stichopus japonicus TaxID=307972 RepID=A0A2G8LM74_STIJA|nr:putative solute carrier family 22 member 3 [Apostichopus japonicus]
MELDEALRQLGDFGRYQTIVYLLISLIGQVPGSWHMLAISFLGAVPEHHCKIPEGGSLEDSIPHMVDPDTGQLEYDSCTVYVQDGTESNRTKECDQWEYSKEPYGDTIVNEWDLVCDQSNLVEISQSVFMAGVMVGSILFGQLSDRFGRKPILFVSLALQVVVGTVVVFSPSIVFFTVVRFFVGVLEQGYDITSYVMVTELFTPRRRAYAGILLTNFWALGIMSLPLLAWLIQDWRYLQLAITLPLLLALPLWWFIPESPRWLLSVGKYRKANNVLAKIARFNGKEADSVQLSSNHKYDGTDGKEKGGEVENSSKSDDVSIATATKEKSATILDLFKSRLILKITVVMMFVWCVNAVIYYGLSLNTGSLAGDPYLNFFLSGAVEIPSYVLAVFVVSWFGRKIPVCVFHVLAGLACAVTVFIPQTSSQGKDLTPLIITTAMTGKFAIAASYAIVFLYASELFPTVVR